MKVVTFDNEGNISVLEEGKLSQDELQAVSDGDLVIVRAKVSMGIVVGYEQAEMSDPEDGEDIEISHWELIA